MSFDITYPVYEVITVQTLANYKIKSMTFADELELRGNILASNKSIVNQLNKVLFKMITEKPEQITDYDTWLKMTTLIDRKSIVAGLYHISYGESYVVTDRCPNCGHTNTSKININKTAQVTMYEGEPFSILKDTIEVTLPVSKIICTVGVPTLQNELDAMSYQMDDKLAEISQITKKMVIGPDTIENTDAKTLFTISNILKTLPAIDVKTIVNTFVDKFTKYDIKLPYKVTCSNCKNIITSEMDFVEQLFRVVI